MARSSYFLPKLLLTALAVAAPLLALLLYQLYHQRNLDEQAAASVLMTRADSAARTADAAFSRVENLIKVLGSREALQKLDGQGCDQIVKGLALVDPVLSNIGAVDLDGRLLCLSVTPKAPSRSYREAPWFAPALEQTGGGQWYLSKPYVGDVTGKVSMNIVAPLKDVQGRRIGLIAAAIDLSYLSQRILSNEGMPQGSVVTMVTPDGVVVGRDPDISHYAGAHAPEQIVAEARRVGRGTFAAEAPGKVQAIIAVTPMNHYGLLIGAASPITAIVAKSRQDFQNSALAMLAVAVVGMLAAMYGARSLNEPLRSLGVSAREIGAGEDARADESLPGEFHELAVEFNAMLDAKKAGEASRRAQAAAEAANEAKSEFLANISHEIRTPMNAILGLTTLALKTELTARQRDYLTKSKVAADSLLELINQVLDFSKIEARKLELEHRPFSLDEVLDLVTAVVGDRARQKGLELLIGVSPNVPRRLVGDSQRLSQVLINLCNNAVKFTAHGEIVLRAAQASLIGDSIVLRFSVQDSGIGMNDRQIARLFRPFSQGDASTARQYGGTGLGLAISKELVKHMGGRIDVTSQEGQGSLFTFTASFGLQAEAAVANKSDPSSDPAAFTAPLDLKDRRMLVIDDSASAREVLKEMLQGLGCVVDETASVAECIDLLIAADRGRPYDVVFVDLRMPSLSGFDLAHRIRTGLRLEHLPKIIIVTGHADDAVMERVRAEGLGGCLLKPVSSSSLLDAVATALGPARAPSAPYTEASEHELRFEDLRGRHVLLVEDNEVNQLVAVDLLQLMAGMRVTTVASGQGAIDAVLHQEFDAVLMDVQMPHMDGYEATRRLRALPALAKLPIIAMTANASPRDRALCLESGMNDFITKPFDPELLLGVLSKWLSGRAAPSGSEPSGPLDSGVSFSLGLRRCVGKVDLYDKIARRYLSQEADVVEAIRAALTDNDLATAARTAHTLVSTAGTVGAEALSQVARMLQDAIDAVDGASWADLINQLEHESTIVRRQLMVYLDGKSAVVPTALG